MTLNGVMTLILRYFTHFVYDVVEKNDYFRSTSVSKSTFDKSMTILIRSARLFSDYLGKTRGNGLYFRLLLPTPMSPGEFLVAVGGFIVQQSELDGRVHVKTRFDGRWC